MPRGYRGTSPQRLERGRGAVSQSPFSISFVAPPEPSGTPAGTDYVGDPPGRASQAADPGPRGSRSRQGSVRMTSQARAAAARLGVSAAEVSQALTRPDRVGPDERDPARTVFRRGDLDVVTGRDGVVIFLRRSRASRP